MGKVTNSQLDITNESHCRLRWTTIVLNVFRILHVSQERTILHVFYQFISTCYSPILENIDKVYLDL